MDSAQSIQRDLFSKFMMSYGGIEREASRVGKLIPTADTLADREKRKRVPTMSGRKRVARGVVEEQLTEVEGILDHLDALTDNIDEAGETARMLAEADPVPGAEEIDLSGLS